MPFAITPPAPYFAVLFTAERQPGHEEEYAHLGELMSALAKQQEGFLGIESVEGAELEITLSYWTNEAAIRAWKAQADHRIAQEAGRRRIFARYHIRVARVEREYKFDATDTQRRT